MLQIEFQRPYGHVFLLPFPGRGATIILVFATMFLQHTQLLLDHFCQGWMGTSSFVRPQAIFISRMLLIVNTGNMLQVVTVANDNAHTPMLEEGNQGFQNSLFYHTLISKYLDGKYDIVVQSMMMFHTCCELVQSGTLDFATIDFVYHGTPQEGLGFVILQGLTACPFWLVANIIIRIQMCQDSAVFSQTTLNRRCGGLGWANMKDKVRLVVNFVVCTLIA
mmetsp:Transcript_27090/g.45151  ORF Transcript_27090/g.45151 Transcript_27090/m.45151 type:complete len:221 (-) Transcript_27090:457-1119(-)